MIFRVLCIVFIVILLQTNAQALDQQQAVCRDFKIVADTKIKFSSDEKKLICGDRSTDSWKEIPVNQAKYHIKVFLQRHGYFFPVFVPKDGKIIIRAGQQTTIRKVNVTGDVPKFFKINRLRKVRKHNLTPIKLDEVAAWSAATLKKNGYACPEISITANPKTGVVDLFLDPGPQQKVVSIKEGKVEGLNEKSLRRFDAFQMNKLYDETKLSLTRDRTENSGVLENTYFITRCKSDGVYLTQKNFAGRPRLFQTGFGVNTEEYALAKASWQHGRLGSKGSKYKADVYASYLRQQIDNELSWYVFNPGSRFYLNPAISLKRVEDSNYHYISGDMRFTPAFSYDNQIANFSFLAGPQVNFTRAYKGSSAGLKRFVSGIVQMRVTSHAYEYNLQDPKAGFEVLLAGDFSHKSLLSNLTVQKISVEGHKLWNVGGYSPSLFVLGIRGGFNSSLTSSTIANLSRLPPNYLFYLGGSDDLRGFGLDELTGGNSGALTSAFASVEGRLANALPFYLEPFIFADAGMLGRESLKFDRTVYFSPGGGVRINSPIGIFRATAAKGYLLNNNPAIPTSLSHWQFYFSFGEEF